MVDRVRVDIRAQRPRIPQGSDQMAVTAASLNAAPQIAGAIRQAARSSGVSFEYLMTTAKIESNLNPGAQASTSSAKGLYQFIEQDLARHAQDQRRRQWPRPLFRRHFQVAGRPLRGGRSGHANGDHAVAQRSGRQRRDGRRLHPRQCRSVARRESAGRRAKASSIWRIFWAPTGRAS
ncbi:MAG: transglycosylase SLT domain-containing protein [Pseudolabrys sp.]